MLSTSLTLLDQLRNLEDRVAWARFVQLYTPLIHRWSRRAGLSEQDADDMVQDIFVTLVKELPEFQHDGTHSFRAWLKTVVMNRWCDRERKKRLPIARVESLDALPASEAFDESEFRMSLVNRALEMIRPEVRDETWNAFVEHGLKRRSAEQVAQELGLTIGAVYAARSRVLVRVQQLVARFIE